MELQAKYTKLFFLASDLGMSDAAGQLALLTVALPRDSFAISVGVLGAADGIAADVIRGEGVAVAALPIRGAFDFSGMRRLRQAVAEANPAVVHAFGADAVRAVRLIAARRNDAPRLIASAATATGGGVSGWFAARQLRRADRVIATGLAQGERYRRLRVQCERLMRINPAVASPCQSRVPDRTAFCRDIAAPVDSKLIFAGGRLDSAHGVKDAVIAFDIARYESPALQLVLTGDGPDRAVAEHLARSLAFDDIRIRFSGARPDLAEAMQLAEMVWVTCDHGGEHLALQAMAAGKPVVAFRTPELAEVIDDGITGYLVPRGDRVAMASKTHALLADPKLATRMGEAGRKRAEEHFSVARMVEMHARVYQELASR